MDKLRKFIFLFLFAFSVSLVFSFYSYAEDTENELQSEYLQDALNFESQSKPFDRDVKLPSIFDVLVRFFIALLIIVGLIWTAAVIYKKIYGPRSMLGDNKPLIKVLERQYIDTRNALYLVETAGKIILLGVNADSVKLLTEIDSEEDKSRIYNILDSRAEEFQTPDFKQALAGFAENSGEQSSAGKIKKGIADSLSGLQTSIEKIKRMLHEKK